MIWIPRRMIHILIKISNRTVGQKFRIVFHRNVSSCDLVCGFQKTCHLRQNQPNTQWALPEMLSHPLLRNCHHLLVRYLPVTANWDVPLINRTTYRKAIRAIFMDLTHSRVLRTNRYTNLLIHDHRHNCLATIPYTLGMVRLHRHNLRAKFHRSRR